MKGIINLKDEEEAIMPQSAAIPPRRRPSFWMRRKIAILITIAIVAILYGAWFLSAGSQWRAVFLTNNQVYFGHFWQLPFSSTITLRDVYYLQLNQSSQLDTQDQSQLKLVKLGSEIHGPTNEMVIPVGQILFWETLRPDSAIVKTINGTQ